MSSEQTANEIIQEIFTTKINRLHRVIHQVIGDLVTQRDGWRGQAEQLQETISAVQGETGNFWKRVAFSYEIALANAYGVSIQQLRDDIREGRRLHPALEEAKALSIEETAGTEVVVEDSTATSTETVQ